MMSNIPLHLFLGHFDHTQTMAMIIFKPFHFKFKPFEPDLIPIFPMEVSFNINYQQNPKTKIHQQQYPICAGYMFMGYKAQGKTLENVMVDIGTTKKFLVTPFLVYITWAGTVMKQRVGHHQTVEISMRQYSQSILQGICN